MEVATASALSTAAFAEATALIATFTAYSKLKEDYKETDPRHKRLHRRSVLALQCGIFIALIVAPTIALLPFAPSLWPKPNQEAAHNQPKQATPSIPQKPPPSPGTMASLLATSQAASNSPTMLPPGQPTPTPPASFKDAILPLEGEKISLNGLEQNISHYVADKLAGAGERNIQVQFATSPSISAHDGVARCILHSSIVSGRQTLVFQDHFEGWANTGDTNEAIINAACRAAAEKMIDRFRSQ